MIRSVILLLAAMGLSSLACGQQKYYCNPVADTIFAADPFVLNDDGLYYLYATSAGDGFKCWTSTDLAGWKEEGMAYRKAAGSWGQGSFWAPEVIKYQGRFYMIYSASGETMFGKGLRICLAVSDHPAGPFKDLHAPLFDHGYSCIDGHIFIDTDGSPYLYFEKVGAVGEHWKNRGYLWGIIMGVKLAPDLSELLHEPKLCLYPSQEWEGLESMKARSNEGMSVFMHNEVYYMTYSGNHYADPNYGVGYATCDQPLGMWVKSESNPVLKADPDLGVSGPGHNCVIPSPDGKEWFMLYHSHANPEKPGSGRILNLDRIMFSDDGLLRVNGPTRTPQPLPTGSR